MAIRGMDEVHSISFMYATPAIGKYPNSKDGYVLKINGRVVRYWFQQGKTTSWDIHNTVGTWMGVAHNFDVDVIRPIVMYDKDLHEQLMEEYKSLRG